MSLLLCGPSLRQLGLLTRVNSILGQQGGQGGQAGHRLRGEVPHRMQHVGGMDPVVV